MKPEILQALQTELRQRRGQGGADAAERAYRRKTRVGIGRW